MNNRSMVTIENCESCIHWQRKNEEIGWCRFSPPEIGEDGFGAWPLTETDDWCSHQEYAPMQSDAVGRPVDGGSYDRLLALIAKCATGPAQAKGRSEIWRKISGEADINPSNFYRMVAVLADSERLVVDGKMYYVPVATTVEEVE